jgi:hypothetical protein
MAFESPRPERKHWHGVEVGFDERMMHGPAAFGQGTIAGLRPAHDGNSKEQQ